MTKSKERLTIFQYRAGILVGVKRKIGPFIEGHPCFCGERLYDGIRPVMPALKSGKC